MSYIFIRHVFSEIYTRSIYRRTNIFSHIIVHFLFFCSSFFNFFCYNMKVLFLLLEEEDEKYSSDFMLRERSSDKSFVLKEASWTKPMTNFSDFSAFCWLHRFFGCYLLFLPRLRERSGHFLDVSDDHTLYVGFILYLKVRIPKIEQVLLGQTAYIYNKRGVLFFFFLFFL